MKITDAANILGLSGSVTPEDAAKAYRAAKQYHPDRRNSAGAEMMKIGNQNTHKFPVDYWLECRDMKSLWSIGYPEFVITSAPGD